MKKKNKTQNENKSDIKTTKIFLIAILFVVLNIILEIVSNIATNQVPTWLEPYLWLSWPILGILAILLIILTLHTGAKEIEKPVPVPQPPEQASEENDGCKTDWGEAIDASVFYSRKTELSKLEKWLEKDHCRLIAIIGMGGMGKTSVAVKLTQKIYPNFEYLFWRDLRNAPLLDDILVDCIGHLSNHLAYDLPKETSGKIAMLMPYLQKHRCLLVLDNAESILRSGQCAGYLREDYEDYGELLRRVGEVAHQSCLLLTSREKPEPIATLEGKSLPVRSFDLSGLKARDAQKVLKAEGLDVSTDDSQRLVDCYQGNALALRLASHRILQIFHGNISDFLAQEIIVFGQIQKLLEQQINRLSTLEQEIMYWLAINREPTSKEELKEDLLTATHPAQILDALESLVRRSLVETSQENFTLQPVVMEYLTDTLISQVSVEIISGKIGLLNTHALIKATSKDYIRNSQMRLILHPLKRLLEKEYGTEGIKARLKQILTNLRKKGPRIPGYTAGNILNFLIYLQVDLKGYDFSGLAIWQGYLQGVELPDINFSGIAFSKTVFTKFLGFILSLAISPDEKILAIGNLDGMIILWDLVNNKQLYILKGHEGGIGSLCFSPDGSSLASGSYDKTIKIWNVSTGQKISTLRGHRSSISETSFNKTRNILASAGEDHLIKLWEVKTGKCIKTLQKHKAVVNFVKFDPTGSVLVSGDMAGEIILWDETTFEYIQTLKKHQGEIENLNFNSDGSVVLFRIKDRVFFWKIQTGSCLRSFKIDGYNDRNWSVWLDPYAEDYLIQLSNFSIEVRSYYANSTIKVLKSEQFWLQPSAVRFTPFTKKLIAADFHQNLKIWDLQTGQCLQTIFGIPLIPYRFIVNSISHSILFIKKKHILEIKNFLDQLSVKIIGVTESPTRVFALSPDKNMLLLGSEDGFINLWDLKMNRLVYSKKGHTNRINSVNFSHFGNIAASIGDDGKIKRLDVKSGEIIDTLNISGLGYTLLFFNDENKLFFSDYEPFFKLWDFRSNRCVKEFHGHSGQVAILHLGPSENTILSGGCDGFIKMWDIPSGDCLKTYSGHQNLVRHVTLSPNNKIIASGSYDYTIRLWDIKSGECIKVLKGHEGGVHTVGFYFNNEQLISSGDDGTLRLWDIASGKCLKIYRPDRAYERMNITGVTGITEAQKNTLLSLGAIEK